MSYLHHHTDSGSDLEIDEEGEHGQQQHHSLLHSSSSSINSNGSKSRNFLDPTSVVAKLEKLPLCCCRMTPFAGLVLLLFGLGFALLIPGILMRLESISSPSPLILFNLCRQPSSWSTPVLDRFRNELEQHGSGSDMYQGVSLTTTALSVYREIPLPDTLLYTGLTYVLFLTLPRYVVGGSISMRMYSGDTLLFNVTTSLHLNRYLGGSSHDMVWLESTHTSDSITKVYNPHLPPAPIHAHGIREEDCRYANGCAYRLRAGMESLILTSTGFTIPTTMLTLEEESKRRHEAEMNAQATAEMYNEVEERPEPPHMAPPPPPPPATTPHAQSFLQTGSTTSDTPAPTHAQRTFQQDESMLIYATHLRLIIDSVEVIESNVLAERESSYEPSNEDEIQRFEQRSEEYMKDGNGNLSPSSHHQSLTKFISPDLLISFHQYQLSPMQHVGVGYIIRGTILLLAASAIAYVKWTSDQQRERPNDKRH